MEAQAKPILIIRTLDGDCTVVFEGVSLLRNSHNNVRKLARKLLASAGIPVEYDQLERELYGVEPSGPQGAYNTKNAVRSLRSALFPMLAPDGKVRWQAQLEKDGKALLRLEKTHASRICLSLPLPPGDPDVRFERERPSGDGATTASVSAAPFTVPLARSLYFYGRESFLADLHRLLLSRSTPCVAIYGSGGMGKTQLAAEYAHLFRDYYPAGVFWIGAKDVQSVQEEYALLSRDFAELRAPQDFAADERARIVRERLQNLGAPFLLILDNLDPDPRVLQLLPVTGHGRLLATTRRPRLLKSRFHTLSLPPLDVHAAHQAIQSCCHVHETAERIVAREPECTLEIAAAREAAAVQGIADDLNQRLPLALTLIAYYVDQRKTTFEECRRRLHANSLKVFDRAEVPYSIHNAFAVTRNELSAEAHRVLAAAACFARSGIAPELLRAVTQIDDLERFEDAIAALDSGSFVSLDPRGRVTLHDLLRDITLEQIEPAERDALLERTAGALVASMERANDEMAWEPVRAELSQSRAVADLCRRHRLYAPLAMLLCELGSIYRSLDETRSALDYLDEAARIVTAHIPEAVSLLAKCRMLAAAADPYSPAAIGAARTALALAKSAQRPDHPSLAEFYNVVGYALKKNGRLLRALPYYYRALRICRASEVADSTLECEYLNNIGAVYEGIGDLAKGIDYLTQARAALQNVYGHTSRRVAIVTNNIGRAQQRLGDFDRALANHLSAREVYSTLYGQENKDYAMSRFLAATALVGLDRINEAAAEAQAALDILERKYEPDDPAAQRVRKWLAAAGTGRESRPNCAIQG